LSWYNPDHEVYDNVGRTAEQIHGFNTGEPTWDDMLRWTEDAAEKFAGMVDLPDTGLTIAGWADALGRAEKLSDFFAISNAILGDHLDAALTALGEFLDVAATWCAWHDQPDLAARYRAAREDLTTVTATLTHLLDAAIPLVYAEILTTKHAKQQATPEAKKQATAPAPPPPAPPAPPVGRTR
jgi:hypothetical protein